jgi:hypothetical protein
MIWCFKNGGVLHSESFKTSTEGVLLSPDPGCMVVLEDRNACVFDRASPSVDKIIQGIKDEARLCAWFLRE